MKKIFVLVLIIVISILSNSVFAKSKSIKCEKPIYYFQDADKHKLFEELDSVTQAQNISVKKFYPELGFISFTYKVKSKPEIVTMSMKQQSHDVYLFMDISKGNTKLEKTIYEALKKHSKNSYLIKDEILCRDFTKDALSINKNRKPAIQEEKAQDGVYKIGLNRYIGYDKKIYFKDRIKEWKEKSKLKKLNKKKIKEYKKGRIKKYSPKSYL